MIIDRIKSMLELSSTNQRLFPATIYYNEGWLLRVVVDWFSRQRPEGHPLDFLQGARWFSEALLPSQFLPRSRDDRLAEGWTHADSVIGHVAIGTEALAKATLLSGAKQFVVAEAKMYSPLSPRVTNASYFDQAARNVACMAEVLMRAGIRPESFLSLSFLVLAPKDQIAAGVFAPLLTKSSIREKVERRVAEYPNADRPAKAAWLADWFVPTLARAQIHALSWEGIIDAASSRDREFGPHLAGYYEKCREFNRIQERDR